MQFKLAKIHYLIIPITIILILLLAHSTVIKAAASQASFPAPSPHPVKHFGLWTTGGFNIEPGSDYYVTLGDYVQITTSSVRPSLSVHFEPPSHTWYMSFENQPPEIISEAKDATLKFPPKQTGTYRFQIFDKYTGFISSEKYYSEIATVHVLPKEIKVTGISDINVDTDYLYSTNNNFGKNEAFASAHLVPSDSTVPVNWSISPDDLATIDDNGKVTAKTGKEGSFFITATAINSDGSTVTKTKLMNVGGGLYDQKARAGTTATFTIQGFDQQEDRDDENVKVSWFKREGGKIVGLRNYNSNQFKYTTETLSEKNNGEKYFAVIEFKNKTLTTSDGLLTVLPRLDPDVKVTSSITNLSFNSDDNGTQTLNKVTNGDEIQYEIDLDNNGNIDFSNSYFFIYLNLTSQISKITVDDKEIKDFGLTLNAVNNFQKVKIQLNKFDPNTTKKIKINTITQGIIDHQNFSSKPFFIGVDSSDNSYQTLGDELRLNYISNGIILYPQNINFEPLEFFDTNTIKYRTAETNSPNEVATIIDQRRDKNATTLSLKQETPFMKYLPETQSLDQNTQLPANLYFYKSDQAPQPLNNETNIYTTFKGQPVKSLSWNKNEGILLHVKNANVPAGTYTSKLDWCFTQSV